MEKKALKKLIMDYVSQAVSIALEFPVSLFTANQSLRDTDPGEITTCLFELVSEGKLVPELRKGEFIHLRSAAAVQQEKCKLKAAIRTLVRKDKTLIKRVAAIFNLIGNGKGKATFPMASLSLLMRALQDTGHSFTDKFFLQCLFEIMKEWRLLNLPFKRQVLDFGPKL